VLSDILRPTRTPNRPVSRRDFNTPEVYIDTLEGRGWSLQPYGVGNDWHRLAVLASARWPPFRHAPVGCLPTYAPWPAGATEKKQTALRETLDKAGNDKNEPRYVVLQELLKLL